MAEENINNVIEVLVKISRTEETYTQEHPFLLALQFAIKLPCPAKLDFLQGTFQRPIFFEEFP